MRFCVCIKQVPDVSASVQTGRMVLNAYDASAVEEALVLTSEHGGSVDLVLVGPESASETIRKALAMGAGGATHLVVAPETPLDSAAVSAVLAEHLDGLEYDVIACGKQAQDTDAGLAGSMLAQRLALPYASNAVGLSAEAEALVVIRQADSGQEIIALPFPCVVTCSNDMNDPRIPSLRGIMAAKKKEIKKVAVAPPPLRLTTVAHEELPGREAGERFEGEPEELVSRLVDALVNDARVV